MRTALIVRKKQYKIGFAAIFIALIHVMFIATPISSTHFKFGSVPVQYILIWLVLFGVLVLTRETLKPLVFTPLELFLVAVMVASSALWELPRGESLRTAQTISGVAFAGLAAMLFKNASARKVVLVVAILAGAISGLVAVLQRLDVGEALWEYTVYRDSTMKLPSGLSRFPVSFSYSVLVLAVLSAGNWITCITRHSGFRPVLGSWTSGLAALFMVLGLIASESRSGILGFTIGITAFLVIGKFMKGMGLILMLVCFILGFSVFYMNYSVRNGHDVENVLEDNRLSENWRIFLPVILRNPFGVDMFPDDESLLGRRRSIALGHKYDYEAAITMNEGNTPHNIFLTTAIRFGALAGLAQIALILSLVLRARSTLRRSKGLEPDEALLLAGISSGIVAFFVHAWFHNANLVMGEARNWFWLGACALLASVARRRTRRKKVANK